VGRGSTLIKTPVVRTAAGSTLLMRTMASVSDVPYLPVPEVLVSYVLGDWNGWQAGVISKLHSGKAALSLWDRTYPISALFIRDPTPALA
jgi:hypothetical protein